MSRKYTKGFLDSYCSKNNITLNKDYSKEKVVDKIRIEGKCKVQGCNNNFDCIFRKLIKEYGGLCKKCFYKKRTEATKRTNNEKYGVEFVSQVPEIRQKAEKTMVEKYGVKYTTQSKDLYDKMKSNNVEKYGVEFISQVPEIIEKVKDTNKERYGVECALQNENIKNKKVDTCIKNYGVEHVSQVPEIREKTKNTNMERYGVENPSQNENIKNKKVDTCIKNYGVEHVSQVPEIREKTKNTNMERYGVECALQSEEVKEKSKATCLERYGVEHAAQNTGIMEKMSKNSYKLKEYTLPSGKIIKLQGYEHFAMDELLQKFAEHEIITGVKNVPAIWYIDADGKKHRYYVDIFIPSENRFIEVKSTWTYKKNTNNVLTKQQASKDYGYKCEIWVYNKKGELVEVLL
jgi:hypothetical protein